ncbi:DZIP3-like protein [Mya arenaria]|uniref:DZIP3-like protein n=1 Tax=Mya arenaria TaxID=6604 RepID=A0ABY7DX30_MYAAR|nr:DZIP3-like protein [Mya arenaria]
MKVTVGVETFGPCKGYNTTLAKKSVACVALNALNKRGSLEAFFKSKGAQSSGRIRRPSARETSTNQPPVAVTRTRSRSLSQSDSAPSYNQPSFGNNRQPSPGPFSRRQPSPGPLNRLAPSPGPLNRLAPSPGPLNRRAPSPGPENRRAPSPSPFDRCQQYPGPLNRRDPSPGPFNRRAPSPSPFSRRAPSPSPFQRCQQSPSPTLNQQPMARVSRELSSENWEDEVDNFAPTFTLHYDKKKKISSSALESGAKSKTADLTNPFLHPVDKSVPAPKHKGITGLCDIELPKSAKEKDEDEKKEPVEEWCEVQTKRKRHASKEPQIEVHKSSAPYVQTAAPSTTAAKTAKYSNFERLIGRMQEEYPDVERKDLIDAIQKIRKAKNSLSGLSMQTIIPGHWDNPRKPKTLVLPPRFSSVASKTLDDPDENICVICHEGLTTEPVKELDCKHAFHTQCIAKWVKVDRTCPTCRKLALFPEEYPLLGK